MLYQDETKKALKNFPITGQPFFKPLAQNIALIKMAAAEVNQKLGVLDRKIAKAIFLSSKEVWQGKHNNQIVVDEIQGGAGTSMNMNVNEVIATLAQKKITNKKIHALDHINKSQSTNDVVPTAMKITSLQLIDALIVVYQDYYQELQNKSKQFKNINKVGRTHLQDAVPITLGQEFGAQASAIKMDIKRLEHLKKQLLTINIGGTAIGTELNAPANFKKNIIKLLAKYSGYALQSAPDLIYSTQYVDGFVEVSAMLTVLATNLIKFMNDLRLMASGPLAGLNEIYFSACQKGSTIMPGKINPVMAEMLDQIGFQITGNHQTIILAAQAGQLELNVMLPIVAKNLFESLTILTNGLKQFTKLGLKGITANKKHCQQTLENSLATATALVPKLGYDVVANYVNRAIKENVTLKNLLIKDRVVTEKEYNKIIN